MTYRLLLPNHEAISYYRWDDLAKAMRDAQHVANGWHEYVEVADVTREAIKVVFVAKPKGEIAKVPKYNMYGNRTWDMDWETDKPSKIST